MVAAPSLRDADDFFTVFAIIRGECPTVGEYGRGMDDSQPMRKHLQFSSPGGGHGQKGKSPTYSRPVEGDVRELKSEIEAGADFADLAKQHSQCPSGKQGGELGEFSPGRMVPEFDKVVFSAGRPGAGAGPHAVRLAPVGSHQPYRVGNRFMADSERRWPQGGASPRGTVRFGLVAVAIVAAVAVCARAQLKENKDHQIAFLTTASTVAGTLLAIFGWLVVTAPYSWSALQDAPWIWRSRAP